MYQRRTKDIQIEVEPEFIPEQSSPLDGLYYFAYRIRITNCGSRCVQLLSRKWTIRDGTGQERCAQGAGVVGVQPHISAGEAFEYQSFCPLSTPTGNMRGEYEFIDAEGERFWGAVPLFFLRDTRGFANSKAWVI